MKGVLPSLVRWARCTGKRDFCPALAAPVGPVQNIFISPDTISLHLSRSPIQLAGQVVLRRLSLKGTVPRDFRLQFFYMAQFPPKPLIIHWGHFEFL